MDLGVPTTSTNFSIEFPLVIAGASVRHLAVSAYSLGIDCVAIDFFGDSETQSASQCLTINTFDELGELLREKLTGNSRLMICGGLENHTRLLGVPSISDRFLGPSLGNIRRCKSPKVLIEFCKKHQISFPETSNQIPQSDFAQWIAKPYASAGGAGIRRLGQSAIASACYYQRLVPGESISAVYHCKQRENQSTRLIGATHQLLGRPGDQQRGFAYRGSIGPIELPEESAKEFHRIGNIVAAQFQMAGLFGIDFVVDGSQTTLIEINPRPTASCEIFERAGVIENSVAMHLSAFTKNGEQPKPVNSRDKAIPNRSLLHGKEIVFSNHQHPLLVDQKTFDKITRLACTSGDDSQSQPIARPTVADIPTPDTKIEPGHPIATVFASGTDIKKVHNDLNRHAQKLFRCFDVD